MAIRLSLCPSNILSLPKLSPKGVVKCDHLLGSLSSMSKRCGSRTEEHQAKGDYPRFHS